MSARSWAKMLVGGAVLIIGGPAMVDYLRPTDEELFKRFNPEIQKRNLENRERRQQEFDHFMTQLKERTSSSRNMWDTSKTAEEDKKKQQTQPVQPKQDSE
ncbi:hypothetical protein H112_08745 [Trichophyton rubrum D6]|uniref:Cytochrome b mRNA-processing protein 4 n=5 Tax=Trichophyton TaxID=5550 RepID=A0A178ERT1_TRIRU|nr:uncharacterized protein TERG_01293 [Trichophyton rubrum CBS 118892]EZF09870.1 hypothetical protein H100_08767 [Trichophyton rubrum MR850]EZF36874.1 hypothetical protein H102_08726 [Trichophyton rubrum CBS 100081]EZF47470.1 hypothetical protein H103_08749 [Trichophyton rubrum CBS 288.86]EZF58127.1 hypothetical protein H104_08700 [Trichophyton rubrum CBS 289.86]EZF68734.1 hypothetical protein H105_08752 [Trichophyton soudanense CBS 452.61]EZF79428.1 hypothetical protein H110_08751 [Trichophy